VAPAWRFFVLRSSILLFALASGLCLAGCPYGNGAPCEVNSDCASGTCCGETASTRGVCSASDSCTAVVDSGVDAPFDTAGLDTGVDTGVDSGIDTGPEDSGIDSGAEDTGVDGGTDTGVSDTGVDAPATDTGIDAP
jgi:hypothetical protein